MHVWHEFSASSTVPEHEFLQLAAFAWVATCMNNANNPRIKIPTRLLQLTYMKPD
jgi:hypothetical protein